MADMTPYSTVRPLFPGALPSWIGDPLDAERIESYRMYEQIYWLVQDTFKVTFRGQEDSPVYLPTPRTIVDTMNRYIGRGIGWQVSAALGATSADSDIQTAQIAIDKLFKRERFKSRYASAKRYGYIRGDWAVHVTADPAKAPLSRISVTWVDPASLFWIFDEDDPDRIVGCHLIDQRKQGNDTVIHRQTYRKQVGVNSTVITSEEAIFKLDEWDDPTKQPIQILKPETALPAQIDTIPVYHLKPQEEPQNPYGSSLLRGFETVLSAINQSVTDEDLALALAGLGVYVTSSDKPQDDDGQTLPWQIGPGTVLDNMEDPNSFQRVNGVSSITPFQDHLALLINSVKEASGATDAAAGKVDVTVAESGVALALQLGPTLAKAEEEDLGIEETMTQLFYDLQKWHQAYEGLQWLGAQVLPTFSDKLPTNRAARVAELNDMMDRKVITAAFYRAEMTKLGGYQFPPDEEMDADIVSETAAISDAQLGTAGLGAGADQTSQGFTDRLNQEGADATAG